MRNLIAYPNRVAHEFDDILNNFFAQTQHLQDDGDYIPRVNVEEKKDEVALTFELPGIEKDNIKVLINDGVLTVSGERTFKSVEDDDTFVRREIRSGQFSRSFTLPDYVDAGSVSADYKSGLLTVKMVKKEEAKPKEIEIKVV